MMFERARNKEATQDSIHRLPALEARPSWITPHYFNSSPAYLYTSWLPVGLGQMAAPLILERRKMVEVTEGLAAYTLRTFSAFRGLAPIYTFEKGGKETFRKTSAEFERLHVSHPEAREVMNAYYTWTATLGGLTNLDTRLRAVGPNSSEALKEAVSIIERYNAALCTGNSGIICSSGSHSSVKQACPDGRVTIVPISPATGQMDEGILAETIRKYRPAALVITLCRTDDGEVENLSSTIKRLIKSFPGMTVLYDLTLYPLLPLLPDLPMRGGDSIGAQKMRAFESLAGDHPAIYVLNPSKSYGVFNLAQIRCKNISHPVMRQIMESRLRIELTSQSYVDGTGYFGTTTISAAPALRTKENIRILGPWGLRLIATAAYNLALDFADKLKSAPSSDRMKVRQVNLNCVSIELNSAKERDDAHKYLKEDYSISAARCMDVFPGLRIVFDLGSMLTPKAIEAMAYAVQNSVAKARGEDCPHRVQFESSIKHGFEAYTIDQRHARALGKFYLGCRDPIPDPHAILLPSEKIDILTDQFIGTLGIANQLFGLGTHALAEAVLALKRLSQESFGSRTSSYRIDSCLRWVRRIETRVRRFDTPEIKLWKGCFRDVAEELSTAKTSICLSLRKKRHESVYLTFIENAVAKTSALESNWIENARAIPRWRTRESIIHK